MKKILFSVMALAVLGLSSCKKDKDDDCALSADAIKGTYKLTALTMQAAGTPAVDVFTTLVDACERDDTYQLGDAGVFTYTDAGTVCTPAGDYTGTWSLTGTTLDMDGDVFTVSEFRCNSFKGTQDFGGVTYVATYTRQ